MDAKNRRRLLLDLLTGSERPLTGTALARDLRVSRQVVVGDIAILRAAGINIFATPQGYMLPKAPASSTITARVACRHGRDNLAKELEIIIDNGGRVVDVIVEHPIYGEITANLMLTSRRELNDFLQKLAAGAEPLSTITGGIHLHTVEVPSREVLNRIERELKAAGILVE
ncbi:MAG TPA: transcription repressor NadR [Selenomonadales bacterium]|nr:transcription repressor NadR [Selenomonadales bacterium]